MVRGGSGDRDAMAAGGHVAATRRAWCGADGSRCADDGRPVSGPTTSTGPGARPQELPRAPPRSYDSVRPPSPTGKHRRHPPPLGALEARVPHRIDATMHRMESTDPDTMTHSVLVQSSFSKLLHRHNSVLPLCHFRDAPIGVDALVAHIATNAPIALDSPPCRPARSPRRWPGGHAESDSIAAMAVSAQYSVTIRVELDARQEPLGKLTAAIAEAGGQLQGVDLVPGAGPEGKRVREFTIDASDRDHWEKILRAIGSTRGARVLDYVDRTMQMHRGGKIDMHNKYPVKTRDDLSMAYTPGVARVCMDIHDDRSQGLRVHDQEEHGRGRLRRHRRARARQHRPRGGDAGDGGQVHALQRVRRRRRLPDLPRHPGRRRDRPRGRTDGADLRRRQPRGHLRPALLRNRGPAEGDRSTSPSSTTTSTAPRW